METLTTIGIIVAFVGGIVYVYIAHFLQMSREQKTEGIDEYKKNTEQVESYVNDYFDAANLIMDLERKVIMMHTIDDCPPVLDKIFDLVNQARKKFSYIKLLKDSEIISLETEWAEAILIEQRKLLDLISTINLNKPINKEMELNRVDLFNRKIAFLHHKLKSRLNELAANAKYK